MTKRSLLRGLISCCFVATACSVTQAALIVEDHFLSGASPASGQYVAGSTITGTNPTTLGSSGNWVGNNDTNGQYRGSATGLTYGELDTAGGGLNYLRTTAANQSQKGNYRPSTDTTARTTYYASFLVNIPSLANGVANSNYTLAGLQFGTTTADVLAFGFRDAQPFLGVVSQANADNNGNTDSYNPSATGTALSGFLGTTHLVVAKIVGTGTGLETISLYVDPTIGSLATEPGTATLTLSAELLADAGSPLSRHYFFSNSSSSSSVVQLDEFRVGTSWADVVPVAVPEPSSVLLAAAGLGILAWRQARRRSI